MKVYYYVNMEKPMFTLCYCIHIVEIPTNKRANSYTLKLLKIGNVILHNQY